MPSFARPRMLTASTALGALVLTMALPSMAMPAHAADSTPNIPGVLTNPAVPGGSSPFLLDDGRVAVDLDDPAFAAEAEAVAQQVHEAALEAKAEAALTAVADLPQAVVPDPLDFASQPDDPADYFIPASADAYRNADGGYSIPRPTAGGTPAGTVPAGLDDYYAQQLDWRACDDFDPAGDDAYALAGAECAYAIVPVDYANPGGATAAIGLLRVPATDQANKIGTLFLDPGGPGGSGMSLASRLDGGTSLHERFDFVGFDPRGVGSSLPMIRCKSNAAFDAQREGSDGLPAAALNEILQRNTESCYEHTGAAFGIDGRSFIANVGTLNVVRDLDVLRSAVGDAKLNYLGYSYGTSIGYHFALEFPDNIRAMILDAAVDPLENNPAEAAKYTQFSGGATTDPNAQIMGFQATFEQFMARCAAQDGFTLFNQHVPCALGTSGDRDTMLANYLELAQASWLGETYETKEADLDARRPLSHADMVTGTIMALYSERLWPYLNAGLADLADDGDATFMLLLADIYEGRDAGQYDLSGAAFQTIWCTDAGTPPGANDNPAAMSEAMRETYRVAPFIDPGHDPDGTQRGIEPTDDWCTYYEVQHQLPIGETLHAMPNVLVISTTYDSATPYASGVVLAAAMGGTLLTVAGASHGALFSSAACVDEIGSAYLLTIEVPSGITGERGVSTKDIYSNVITGDECQVHSFRPVPGIADARGEAGTTVTITADGLVRNTDYTPMLPAGFEIDTTVAAKTTGAVSLVASAATVTANVDGTVSFAVRIPADAAAGEVEIGLVPADPLANDPTVRPLGMLTVLEASGAETPSATTTVPGGQQPGEEPPVADGTGGSGGGTLPVTGGELPMGLIAAAVLALLAGGAITWLARHRAPRRS